MSQTNFTNNTFLSNAANLTSSGGGGAVYLDGGITLLNGNTFQQNSAPGYGGALVYTREFCQVQQAQASHTGHERFCLSSLHLKRVNL